MARYWFYLVEETRGGAEAELVQHGPVPVATLAEMIAAGRIGPDSWLWHHRLSDWEPAHQHFHFAPQEEVLEEVQEVAPPPSTTNKAPDAAAQPDRNDFIARVRHNTGALAQGQSAPSDAAHARHLRFAQGHAMNEDAARPQGPARFCGPLRAVGRGYGRMFSFGGRASRSEFWFFMGWIMLVNLCLSLVSNGLSRSLTGGPVTHVQMVPTMPADTPPQTDALPTEGLPADGLQIGGIDLGSLELGGIRLADLAIFDTVSLLNWIAIAFIGFSLVNFMPILSLTVRRMHDTGRSGTIVLAYYGLSFLAFLIAVFSMGSLLSDGFAWYLAGGTAETLMDLNPMRYLRDLLIIGALSLIAAVISLIIFVFTLFPGQDRPNAYG